MKEFWDQRYTTQKFAYGTAPNKFLKEFLEKKIPGKLLLPGEGEGRNAVYAAKKGWEVDAFDFSTVGRNHALKFAEANEVEINYYIDNVENFKSIKKYDLIAVIFVQLDNLTRRCFHKKLHELLEPGGKVLLEAFSLKQLENTSGGPRNPDMLYEVELLKTDFDTLQIEMLEEMEVFLNEGHFHHGNASVIRMIAAKR